jgi:hypothetical protein
MGQNNISFQVLTAIINQLMVLSLVSALCSPKKFDTESCGLLGYYTASCGICLPTFRDNVSVPTS